MRSNRLRGLNFGGWLSQIDAIMEKDPDNFPGIDAHMASFIGADDFRLQRQWGFNHIRLPIDAYHFFDDNQHPIESRLVHLDNAVAWTKANGIACSIDLHECPGHDFAEATEIPIQKLFADPAYLQKAIAIWICIAERYSGENHVLFEALNEPVAPDAAAWNAVKDPLCKAIRARAPSNTIIVGSNMWNWPSTFRELTPLDFDNVMYNFHFYEPLLFTHQGVPWMHEPETKGSYTYPGDYGPGFVRKYGFIHSNGSWNRDRFIKEILPVAQFGSKHDAPIICNEFGVYAPVPIEAQLHWLADFLSVLHELDIGFSYWNYKNLDFGIISRGERLHASLPQYDNPQRINYQVLEVLQQY